MVMEYTTGQMARFMKVSGQKTKLKDLEFISGLMEGSTKANGKITIWMAQEPTLGSMAGNMKVTIPWIRKMDTESIDGQMGDAMRDTGRAAASTEKANTLPEKE